MSMKVFSDVLFLPQLMTKCVHAIEVPSNALLEVRNLQLITALDVRVSTGNLSAGTATASCSSTGSGFRQLRLVSKEVKRALQTHIKQLTLTWPVTRLRTISISDSALFADSVVRFMKFVNLLKLCIVISPAGEKHLTYLKHKLSQRHWWSNRSTSHDVKCRHLSPLRS